MSLIEQALVSAIKSYPHTPIVIAYSGGVDSQVLLHALSTLKKNQQIPNTITVCHVNHGLSANALTWQKFAEQQCEALGLTLIIKQVNVKTKAQNSLEALARDARYQALKNINAESSLIITGHHGDDQSETFLLALKRGAGLKGLASMALESNLDLHKLIRPLLSVSRHTIVSYAQANQLKWIEDESNTDISFDRNFIRQEVMPLLIARWGSISQTINRSVQHCRSGQELLDELAEQDLSSCQITNTSLDVAQLKLLSVARFNNIIRYFLDKHQCLMPSTEQLAQVRQQLFADNDKNPAVKVAAHYLRRFKSQLHLTHDFQELSTWIKEISLTISVDLAVELPDGLGLLNFSAKVNENTNNNETLESYNILVTLPKKDQEVSVRFSHNNPRCLPDYRQHSKDLKKILQELNVPPWQRKRIPFVYYDDVLVAAVGFFVCREFVPNTQESVLAITLVNSSEK